MWDFCGSLEAQGHKHGVRVCAEISQFVYLFYWGYLVFSVWNRRLTGCYNVTAVLKRTLNNLRRGVFGSHVALKTLFIPCANLLILPCCISIICFYMSLPLPSVPTLIYSISPFFHPLILPAHHHLSIFFFIFFQTHVLIYYLSPPLVSDITHFQKVT